MESEVCTKQVVRKKKGSSNKPKIEENKISASSKKIKKLPVFEDLKQKSPTKQTTFEEIEQKIFDKKDCYLKKLKRRPRNAQSSSANEVEVKESLLPQRPKKTGQKEVENIYYFKSQTCSLVSAKMERSNGLTNAKVLKTKSKLNKCDESSNNLSLSLNCKSNKMNRLRLSKSTCKMPIADSNGDNKIEKERRSNISANSVKRKNKSKNNIKVNDCKKYDSSSESGASDWENVDELSELLNQKESVPRNENLVIELKQENILWGYKKRIRRTEQDLIEDYVRKQVNKSIREVYENMHKCHLLCLFAHGEYVNEVITSQNLLATSMSIIPKNYFTPKRFDLPHLEKFVKWFCKHIVLKQNNFDNDSSNRSLEDILSERLSTKSANSNKVLVLLFILISRSIGMDVRLVFSFYPISWKPSMDCLVKPKREESEDIDDLKVDKPSTSTKASTSNTISNNNKKKFSRKMISSDSDDEIVLPSKGKRKKQIKPTIKVESSDSEFEPDDKNIKAAKKVSKSNDKSGTKRKSFDGVEKIKKVKREVLGEWAEVYVEEEEKWISVDISRGKIHCASDIEARIPSNTAYVVAYHADHTVKDVTKRYVSSWLSNEDKIRCDGSWWDATLRPFLGPKTRKDKEEDNELDEKLRKQPQPNTVGEFKNHPLYALPRHLLKFEAIYPPNPSPIGFFKGEAVYPRECVKAVSGREHWIKEAKVVRVGEEPYKVVKARPKWDKGLGQLLKDRPLELFGEWQVEDYEPPIARNGKVPRNEYGNVELFKPSMLPKGCIHLPIAGLARIARKLDIDCAPALVGFDYHKGGCHPINDGFVICEEFKEILLDAWDQVQAEQAKRDEERKLKRIYDNWKRLIRGMILKRRIKETYGDANKQVERDCDTKEGQEKSIERTKKSQTKRKMEEENLTTRVPNLLLTHPVVNLKIDYDSCIYSMTKEKRRTNTARKKKVLIEKGNKGTINKEQVKSTNEPALSDDSDDSVDMSKKQEKIRKILEWNPDKGVGRSNPNLSDYSDKETSDLETPRLSLPCKTQANKKCKKIKGKKIKNDIEKECQTSTSEGSSASDFEEMTVNSTKRLSLRSRGKKMISYNEGGCAVASDISIDDSDIEDKTFIPVKKKPIKSLLDLSDESS